MKLDSRAQHRLLVLNHVLAGELTATEAAGYLRLTLRSVRRLLARHRGPAGVAALVHGNTGRTPANRLPDELGARLVELATDECKDINRAHLADLLDERQAICVPERTLRPSARRSGPAGRPPSTGLFSDAVFATSDRPLSRLLAAADAAAWARPSLLRLV